MSERELKSITFEDLGITYVIPSSGSSSGDVPKVVEDHINSKDNPHEVTYDQVGAAPAEIISYSFAPSAVGELDTLLKGVYDAMGQNSRKFIYANMLFEDGLSGGVWQITLAKTADAYGFIIAECYTPAPSPLVKTRTIYGGAWGDWYDISASAFAPSGYGYGDAVKTTIINTQTGTEADFNTALDSEFSKMGNETAQQVHFTDYSTGIGDTFLGTLYKNWSSYGWLKGVSYSGHMMQKVKKNGSWQPWEYVNPPLQAGVQYRTTMRDNGKALYLRRGNNGAIFYRRDGEDAWYAMASRIDGTFANVVAANPTAQDPATRQLRNSTIASTETTPSYNGEICWVYE